MMRYVRLIGLFVCFFFIVTVDLQAQKPGKLKVMSFNIRMNYQDDGVNNWGFRKSYLTDVIKKHKPDLLGIQEAYFPQFVDLKNLMVEYDAFGPVDGRQGAESVGVLYLKTKMCLIDSGTFWLSQTPAIQSLGWDANLRRTVTWGKFEIKDSGRKLFFFTTHFDFKGKQAPGESTKLLLKKVKEIAGQEIAVVTGDFNFRETSKHYKMLTEGLGDGYRFFDSYHLANEKIGPTWSLNSFGKTAEIKRGKIDFIFSNHRYRVSKYENIAEHKGDFYPSDHNPQVATYYFK